MSTNNRLASFFPAEATASTATVSVESTLDAEIKILSLEAQIEAQAFEQAESDANELMDIAAGLESLRDLAQASLEDGGLKRESAALLGMAVDAQTQRLGFQESIIPSVESFGTDGEALTATQVSIESAGDTLKKIWEAIKKAVAKAVEMAKRWWIKAQEMWPKQRRKAEDMIKALDDLGDVENTEFSVSGGTAKNLALKGKLPAPSALISSIKSLVDSVDKSVFDAYGKALDKIEAGFDIKEPSGADVAKYRSELKKAMEEIGASLEGKLGKGDEMVGQRTIEVKVTDGSVRMSIKEMEGAKKVEGDDLKIKTPSTGDIKSMLELVKDGAKSIEDSKKAADDIDKKIKDAMSKAEKAVKDAEGGDKKALQNHVGNVSRAMQSMAMAANSDMLRLLQYVGGRLDALTSLCAESMKQYKKK